jgi:hypothetical protein
METAVQTSTHHHDHTPLPERERLAPEHRWIEGPLMAGTIVFGLLTLLALYINPAKGAFSYLFGFTFWYTLAVGSFFWMILHFAVDADWSVIIRRHFENVTTVFWVLAVLFIPLLPIFLGKHLWAWTNLFPEINNPDALFHGHPIGTDTLMQSSAKNIYLSWWFTYIRLAFYFSFFILAGAWFRKLSTDQDADGNPIFTVKMRWWAPLSIVGFGVAMTFSAIDWLMALDFHWYSTMWGVYIFAGSAQSSMALAIVMACVLKSMGYLRHLSGEHSHLMGKLLFAFTVFWAYIAFSQYMLIWYANIPEETVFFKLRNQGWWNAACVFLVAGHFVLPFFVLLFQYSKKSFVSLLPVACWILFMQGFDLYWIIQPNLDAMKLPNVDSSWYWGTPVSFLFVGCAVAWTYWRNLAKAGLFPARDPRIINCMKVTN